MLSRRRDIQHNGILHKDTKENATQHEKHSAQRHTKNDTKQNGFNCDTAHKQHIRATLSFKCICAECLIFIVVLSEWHGTPALPSKYLKHINTLAQCYRTSLSVIYEFS